MTRLTVVSDSHLSPRAPVADVNWASIVHRLEATRPDLVVHTGDISLDGANDLDDLRHARSQLDRVPVPWRAVPGNHDLGEPHDATGAVVEQRRRHYESEFGDRFWSTTLDRWRLVGLDSQQLLAADGPSERWWRWTAEQLTTEQPTVVFQHRPLTPTSDAEVDARFRYMTEPARARLRALLARPNVELVVSGHVHQWRSVSVDGTPHVWAPSTWATLPDSVQPVIGTKVVGLVEIDLEPSPRAVVRTPPGVVPAIVGVTIPSPYGP